MHVHKRTHIFVVYASNATKETKRTNYLVDLSSNRMVRCVRSMEFCQVKCSFWVCRMSLGAIRSAIVHRAVTTSVSMFPSYEIDPHASYYYQNLSFFSLDKTLSLSFLFRSVLYRTFGVWFGSPKTKIRSNEQREKKPKKTKKKK